MLIICLQVKSFFFCEIDFLYDSGIENENRFDHLG